MIGSAGNWQGRGVGCPRLGCFPSPPFPSVSKAFQQQEEECSFPWWGWLEGGVLLAEIKTSTEPSGPEGAEKFVSLC